MGVLRALRQVTAIVTIAAVPACGTFVTYSEPARQDSEVAIVKGYYRNYLLFLAEGKITAVDGARPSNLLGEAFSAKLLPGSHWIEITEDRYFGGSHGSTVCALEFDFEAGHLYQIEAGSSKSQTSWHRIAPGALYAGSVAFRVFAPGTKQETRRTGTTCMDGGGSLCRQVSDCAPHEDMRCIPQGEYGFGKCGFESR